MNKRPEDRLAQQRADDLRRNAQGSNGLPDLTRSRTAPEIAVALLTGGADKPYAFGLATALIGLGIGMDLVGNDELDCPEFRCHRHVRSLNLRGSQRPDAGFVKKVARVAKYYARLIRYAASAKPKVFHILWNNRFEAFDRTVLMLYYKCLRKKLVLTAHNVNVGRRDSTDTLLNRLTLRIQYRLADHVFVHTAKMKSELTEEFEVHGSKVSVIPFGINNSVPNTLLTAGEAKRRLGIRDDERTVLFFGNIAPYKGLEHLASAFRQLVRRRDNYRLIIAGRPKRCERYWTAIKEVLHEEVRNGQVLLKVEFIPDCDVETYFKAADVLVLPYRYIYQSGVLLLSYSFGLPVLAANVGSLKDDIIEGETGFVFKPEDSIDLAAVVERYFGSGLYMDLERRRQEIRNYAMERHSWDAVARLTLSVYAGLARMRRPNGG